jgi:hypothetical protein
VWEAVGGVPFVLHHKETRALTGGWTEAGEEFYVVEPTSQWTHVFQDIDLAAGTEYNVQVWFQCNGYAWSWGLTGGAYSCIRFAPMNDFHFGTQVYNRDGYFELVSVTLQDDHPDLTAPTTRIAEGPGAGSYCGAQRVRLVADDTGGLGVRETWYQAPGMFEPALYAAGSWIDIAVSGSLSFHSIDLGGNQESTNQIDYVIRQPSVVTNQRWPYDGAVNFVQPISFQWEPVAGATQYHWQTDETPVFDSPYWDVVTQDSACSLLAGEFQSGTTHHWRVRAFVPPCWELWSAVRSFSAHGEDPVDVTGRGGPPQHALLQNYPNPFNPSTVIAFDLPRDERVTVDVYDLAGNRVRTLVTETLSPGRRTVIWDGRNDAGNAMPSGLYIYRMHTTAFEDAKKMLLLR